MTTGIPPKQGRPDPGPAPAVARATVRMTPIEGTAARGTAAVPGAIDPWLRYHPPYAPPPAPQPLPPPVAPEPPADVVETGEEPDVGPEWPQIPGLHWVDEDDDETGGAAEPSAPGPAPNPDVPTDRKKRRLLLPLVAAAVTAFVGGTGYLMVTDRPAPESNRWTGTPPAATAAAPDPAPYAVDPDATDPFRAAAPAYTGAPTRLKVAAIGLDSPLESLRIGGNGELTPPRDFAKAGWYADGTSPGDVGPAVIAGHVDSKRGPAVFYDLRKLTRGDVVEVVRGGETVRFTVVSTAWYPKNAFPTNEVYGPTPDRQLRLITCGGVFDRTLRSYRDNLVVYAVAG